MKTISPETLASELRYMVSAKAVSGLPTRIVFRCPAKGCGHELQHRGAVDGVAVFECLHCLGVWLNTGELRRVSAEPPAPKKPAAAATPAA